MTDEQFIATAGGGILYDASRLSKPSNELFLRSHWAALGALQEIAGGRSSIALLETGVEHGSQFWVLRHYRRGGLVAKLSQDSYLWSGASRTRSFREWRLLAELRRRGLPVPAPIAARYVRSGLLYRADLITQLLPATHTLATLITGRELGESSWRLVGRTIAAFHREGVHHADLNANNIVIGEVDGTVYLLDFDRGRIRRRGAWEGEVLARLKRSLEKIRRQRKNVKFGEREWAWLSSEAQRLRL
jgi:3-deoxy-D-manno-octulosonic acid kinase